MSVMPHEGTHLILFGSVRMTAGTRIHEGYLSRPDLGGAYATVAIVPTIAGITSGVKDLCRRIARHGIAVVAMDPYRGSGPGRRAGVEDVAAAHAKVPAGRTARDLGAVVRWLRSPGTEWADPERIGVLGLGTGGRTAVVAAPDAGVRAVAVCYSPLGDALDAVAELSVPLLGIYGREDETVDAAVVTEARAAQPISEWVIYEDAGHDFLDDGGATYEPSAANDALDRIVAFFDRTLSS